MLTEPLEKFRIMYRERERYDITKPAPYDKDEAYERKKAEQANLFPGDKIIDTSLQRIAFHKYQDYSLAAIARKRIGQKYTKIANRIDILSANGDGESKKIQGKNGRIKQLIK